MDESYADTNASTDPFAEADEDTGETKQSQNYIHIRIQRKLPTSRYPASSADTCPNFYGIQNAMVARH